MRSKGISTVLRRADIASAHHLGSPRQLRRLITPIATSITTSIVALIVVVALGVPSVAAQSFRSPDFVTFESGHVRPLALSPDGRRLFAVNTPDARLEIFDVRDGLEWVASVPVGLEPVAVAARTNREVWVVNHLSDSVSILDVKARPPRVVRTLLVGDEPRDIVFAHKNRRRAFITTAHRGQHRTHPSLVGVDGAGDPQLTTPGVPRADVWVFDARQLGDALGGVPLEIVELFGDTPRPLAVSADGETVYAGVFLSGNRTTVIPESAVCDGFVPSDLEDACPEEFPGVPGGLPGPATNHAGAPAPEVGLIVRYDAASGEWRDELQRDWSAAVRFDLPDLDVFAIDADTLATKAAYPQVGTVLFNMAVNPVSGKLYVSNTEARNEVRFEGPGEFAGSTVQGRLHEARISVIDTAGGGDSVAPRHLNKHIDYTARPAPRGTKRHSLATPLGMAISSDGATLWVAAFGSGRIGVFDTAALEDGTFDPVKASSRYLHLSGGGPTGLVLDEDGERLFVLTRFDNTVSAIDLGSGEETERVAMLNPEPPKVVDGRRFLYDAQALSSNGEASCASCHIFGGLDGLAWDLGDPDGDVSASPILIERLPEALAAERPINGTGNPRDFHPMKGPMTTQTLRGLGVSGSLHWRADRSSGIFGDDPKDTSLAFRNFAVAYPGLVGHRRQLSEGQMRKFANFALEILLPPNPIRRLDNFLPEGALAIEMFDERTADAGGSRLRCGECHIRQPLGGHFGTDGRQAFLKQSQIFKVPHLRNLYQKVGMFGTPRTAFFRPGGEDRHMGDQVRGFGFLHDGSVDTIFNFLQSSIFIENGDPVDGELERSGFRDDADRRAVEAMLLGFETDLAPIVGQQITVGPSTGADADERLALLVERSGKLFNSKALGGVVRECELIVHGTIEGEARGALWDPAAEVFVLDRATEPGIELPAMLALARRPGQEMTFTCVPPGSGTRMALDRDRDGTLNGDE